MDSKSKKYQRYSRDFKLRLLKEFYESGYSKHRICKKHHVDPTTFSYWLRVFETQSLSLPENLSELENQVYMARKKSVLRDSASSQEKTELEKLQDENQRLRKALAYSELRNEALHEVLKIGRERYGLDLLKKAGAKQ